MATTTSTTSSNSTLGQSVIASLNAGSGVDTSSLVTNLTAAQKASLEDPITAAQTKNAAQVSTAASIASDLATFKSSLDTLIAGGTLATQPTTSDASVVGVSLISGRRLSSLSSTVEVTQLAQAQVIESKSYAASDTLAAGSLTITVNGTATAVTLSNGSNSLSDMVSAINAANTGVTASLASDTSGNQRLVLKGASGADNAFTVSSDSYAELNYSGGATTASASGMGQSQAAQNAILKMDGVTYERASNIVGDVVTGVTLTLSKIGTATLGVQKPTSSIASAISDFVSAFNALKSELDTATAAATTSTDAGALRGNATIRDLRQQLTKLTTTKLIASGSVTTLAELGVATARDGTLSVDTTTLNKMLAAYPADVEAMFNPTQSSSNSAVTITSKVGSVAAGTYALTGLTSATDSGAATGSIDGSALTGAANTLTAAVGSTAAGLTLTIATGLSNASGTLSIDLGLSGALSKIVDSMTNSKTGAITALQTRLEDQSDDLADKLEAAEKQLTVYHDRLVSQFSSMETRVSAYKATQSYLTQQIDLWTKSDD